MLPFSGSTLGTGRVHSELRVCLLVSTALLFELGMHILFGIFALLPNLECQFVLMAGVSGQLLFY